MNEERPIGVIDSGKGGRSVLSAMQNYMPGESYIYLADELNAPYGNKTADEIIGFMKNNAEILMRYDCKALVIACNTATSVSAEKIRALYPEIPVIGLEPAIKPALSDFPGGNVLVLATPVTLKEKKFTALLSGFPEEIRRGVVTIAAQKLVSFVEAGLSESDEVVSYLKNELKPYKKVRFSACVLGCTHFPFAKNSIVRALGYRPVFYDGGDGAARFLKKILEKRGELISGNQLKSVLNLSTKSNK